MTEASRAPAPSHATLPRLAEPPATVYEHLVRRFPHVGEDAWIARLASGTRKRASGICCKISLAVSI